jgi:hypothetical protein
MTKFIIAIVSLCAMAGLARAGATTPGPLLGAVAGPWGLVVSMVGYGAYRLIKTKRS